MRDLLVIAIVVGSMPLCFLFPFFGGLMWTWIAFMNPHRLAWGYALLSFSPAYLVAVPTLLGFLLSKEPKRLPRCYGTYGFVLLWILMSLSAIAPINQVDAYTEWAQRSKMFLMALVIVSLTATHDRLRLLLLVTALSIGFYGAKGGVFAIVTGGQHHVLGPYGTFIGGNNHLGLALNMTLPMFFYLAKDVRHRGLAILLRAVFVLSLFATVATQSRGALLGLITVATLFFLKSRQKLVAGLAVGVGVLTLSLFAPAQWFERMETIRTYDHDGSAMSRIHAWTLAWRLALASPFIGWGPQAMDEKSLYDRYYPDSPSRNDVHSAYFQILSESGFPAFCVWLSLLAWSFFSMQRVLSQVRHRPEHSWMANYASMIQISLAAYAISGMFLEMAYFDLIYHVLAAAMILTDMAARLEAVPATVQPPRVGILAHRSWAPQAESA